MKIEFLKEGSPDCPLIRIYGNEPLAAAQLASGFRQLANGQIQEIQIHEMPGFQPIEGCLLFARRNDKDIGVMTLKERERAFECLLRSETWEQLAELVDPFSEQLEGVRFQWLDETSEISLLISNSKSGYW